MHTMPEGRPPGQPHSKGVIVVGIIQGLLLTAIIFLLAL